MKKSSDVIGLPVITLSNAQKLGTVADLWFDSKFTRLRCAEIFDEQEDTDERVFIPADKLVWGENAAVLRSEAHVRADCPARCVRNPVNRECYNVSGKKLGCVRDVILDGLNVTAISVDGSQFSPDKLLRASDSACVFNDTDEKIKLPKSVKRKSSPQADGKGAKPVAARTYDGPADWQPQVETPATPSAVTVTRTPLSPDKDYGFLLGKTLHSHIVSNGRILIEAGTVVDENVIEFAKRENKLVRLALQAY